MPLERSTKTMLKVAERLTMRGKKEVEEIFLNQLSFGSLSKKKSLWAQAGWGEDTDLGVTSPRAATGIGTWTKSGVYPTLMYLLKL